MTRSADAALEEAVLYGDLAAAEDALKNQKANPNHAGFHGITAMHRFAATANVEGLELMHRYGGNVNQETLVVYEEQNMASSDSVNTRKSEQNVASLLVRLMNAEPETLHARKKSIPTKKVEKRETPLDFAIHNAALRGDVEQFKTIDFLLAAGADILPRHIEAARASDQTPLAEHLQRIVDGAQPRPTFDDIKRLIFVEGTDAPPLGFTVASPVEQEGKIKEKAPHIEGGRNSCHG